MEIDRDIFECAVYDLSKSELISILDTNEIVIEGKRKFDMINKLLKMIDEKTMTEGVYQAVYSKAFLGSEDCNEGFYYRYTDKNILFEYERFKEVISARVKNEEQSRYGANVFKYNIRCLQHNENKKIITFTFKREKKNKRYDSIDKDVKIFNEILEVNVEIDYKNRLVYLESQNYNNSQVVKAFLDKILNELRIDKTDIKINLISPKLDGQLVQKWAKENEVDINGVSVITIRMLDLLSDFKNEKNKFVGCDMRKIYFEVNKGKLDGKGVEETTHRGNNIEDTVEIAEEIFQGKKINGFQLDVEYLYGNEDEGESVQVVKVPISILQEEKKTVRISVGKDNTAITKEVRKEIYLAVKDVFIKKLNVTEIENTEAVETLIARSKDTLKRKGEKNEAEKKEDETIRV